MYNIVYFEKNIIDESSKALKIYLKAINNNLISNPIIFCDKYKIIIDNIPIFHTYYIKNIFHKLYILTNKYDTEYLVSMGLDSNIIVVYDSIVENYDGPLLSYDYSTDNFNKFIKELHDETI